MAIFGYNSVFGTAGKVIIRDRGDGNFYNIYSVVATDSGPLSDLGYMYNYNGQSDSRNAGTTMYIYNTAGTSAIKRYSFSTTIGDGPAWRLTSSAVDMVSEPAVVKGTRYRIVFSGGTSDWYNSGYHMQYRYDEVGSTNNYYWEIDPDDFEGAYTDIRRMSFYVTLEYTGPSLLIEGITPSKIEGVDWVDIADIK
jgi:hypothetical protein